MDSINERGALQEKYVTGNLLHTWDYFKFHYTFLVESIFRICAKHRCDSGFGFIKAGDDIPEIDC